MERIGGYAVTGELGRGGGGVVYRARSPGGGPEVAIKVLLAAPGSAERAAKRFQIELGAVARLRHPHLVAVQATGEDAGRPYLVLDLVPGGSLQDRLDRTGPLPVREAAEVVQKLALALDYAHGCGVVHRDVKPDNVLVDAAGEPRLTDFGLARDLASSVSRASRSGLWLGTPGYWPPEQASGQLERIGPAADVYALGATLFALLTGEPPFGGGALVAVLDATEREAPRSPAALRPEVDADLAAICLRWLAKAPEGRYPSAAALARDLGAYLRGERRPVRRGRRAPRAGLALLLGAVGLGTAGLLGWRALGEPRTPPPSPLEVARAAALEVEAVDPLGAVALWTRVIELAPDRPEGWRRRAFCRMSVADWDGAAGDLDREIALTPGAAEPHFQRATCHDRAGRTEEAVADYTRGLDLDPARHTMRLQRALLRGRVGDLEGALADFDRLVVAGAHNLSFTLGQRALYHRRLGDHAGAVADYTLLIALRPLRHGLWTYASRGFSRYRLGDLSGAAADLSTAIEQVTAAAAAKPDQAFSATGVTEAQVALLYRNRGSIRVKQGALVEAVADLTEALRRGVADPHSVLADRAHAHDLLGRRDEARADLRRAIELAPPDDRAELAARLARLGG